jgi:hypothetical protein
MIRLCTAFALFELALLGACLGLPTAKADPAEECCGMPKGGECSGCIGGYLLGPGNLYGCVNTGLAMDCSEASMRCNGSTVPIIRWRDGNCIVFKEIAVACDIYMPGCTPTECN